MNQTLREKVRRQQGRSTQSAAIIDSQSVKTTEVAQAVGYDGAKQSKATSVTFGVDTWACSYRLSLVPLTQQKAGAEAVED